MRPPAATHSISQRGSDFPGTWGVVPPSLPTGEVTRRCGSTPLEGRSLFALEELATSCRQLLIPEEWGSTGDGKLQSRTEPVGGGVAAQHLGGQGAKPPAYRQNIHQGRFAGPSRALTARSWWSWSTSCLRASSSCSWASILASNAATRRASLSLVGCAWSWSWSWSGTSTSHVYPWGVSRFSPLSNPLASRRLTVCGLTCRCDAASVMVICMVGTLPVRLSRWVPGAYAVFTRSGGVLVW